MPPDGKYPASLQDINYAIRWCKSRAKELKADPERVAVLGVSSGGHQAMLSAMRPGDARYASLPLSGKVLDASVRAVILCWPVIDPLGRYEYAKANREGKLAKNAAEWIACHDMFWAGEAEMAEGNPTRALERGEKTQTPPVLYLQGTADVAHPVPNRDRFIELYRKAGGRVDLHLLEGVGEGFMTNDPTSTQAREALEKIIDFVHREL
jgi:acetyl esterase/lipase